MCPEKSETLNFAIPGSIYFTQPTEPKTIGEIIKEFIPENPEVFKIPESTLQKNGMLMDIVSVNSIHSLCFTKSYGRFVEGTGSVLQTNSNSVRIESIEQNIINLQLRFFTPREIAALHSFPAYFKFPFHSESEFSTVDNLSPQQCYKLIGNSLNVIVISELLKYLFKNK